MKKDIEPFKYKKKFAIWDNTLYWIPENINHYEWLCGENSLIGISEKTFKRTIIGHVENGNVYFYRGDFKTDVTVENYASDYINIIINETGPIKHLYCGIKISYTGKNFKPIKEISL